MPAVASLARDEETLAADAQTREAYPLDVFVPQDYEIHRARSKSSVTDFAGGHRACYLRMISLAPEIRPIIERALGRARAQSA